MGIIIKKRISFDFLGDDYKESYIILKAMPSYKYDEYLQTAEKARKDLEKKNDLIQERTSMKLILESLEEYFIEGKFDNTDFTKEQIKEFDKDTLITLFQLLTGQISPKAPSS